MDFACPDPIMEAIKKRASHPVLGYGIRSDEYYHAVLHWLEKRFDWQVPKERLMFNPPGDIHGITELVKMLTKQGDEIIVQTPAYKPLTEVIEKTGRRLLENPLTLKNGTYELDFEQLIKVISCDTKMLILCSPHNPTGRVWKKHELIKLAQICHDHNIIVISDEVHSDLIYPDHKHTPYGSLEKSLIHNSITVISPSKSFNTARLPQSSLIIPSPDIREKFKNMLDISQLNLDNSFADVALIAGYNECASWLDQLMVYIAGNFKYMQAYFEKNIPEINCIAPEGTYLAWLDFRAFNLQQQVIMDLMVIKGGVGLYNGLEFGTEGEGFFRINLACPRSFLEQGLRGISASFND